MQTRFLTMDEELIALKGDWDRLIADRPETNIPFYSWDWFYRSWIYFGKPIGQELFIVAVYEEDKLVGILPLVRGRRTSSGITYRILRFCNVGMMPRNTFYTDARQDQESIFRAAWNHLSNNRSVWDMLEFANVPDTNPFHHFILEEEHGTKYARIHRKGLTSPFVSLEGLTYDKYFSKYGNKDARRRFQRVSEKYEKENKRWEMKLYENESDIQTGIDLALAVRKESWKGTFENEEDVLFYRELFAEFALKKEVIISLFMLEDKPIAAQFLTGRGGRYFLHTNDYHTGFREDSPGICLLHLMLMEAFNREWKIFDFTGSDYDYKKASCTGYQNHSTFQVFHSGWKSRFVYSAKTFWLPMFRKILRRPAPQELIAKSKHF